MVGLIFTICLLTLLVAVGFIFAWMVRLASEPQPSPFMPPKEVTTSSVGAKKNSDK